MKTYKIFTGCPACGSIINASKKEIPWAKFSKVCQEVAEVPCKNCKADSLYTGIIAPELTDVTFTMLNAAYKVGAIDEIVKENIVHVKDNRYMLNVSEILRSPALLKEVDLTFGFKNTPVTESFLLRNKIKDLKGLPVITANYNNTETYFPISLIDLLDSIVVLLFPYKRKEFDTLSYFTKKQLQEIDDILSVTVNSGVLYYT